MRCIFKEGTIYCAVLLQTTIHQQPFSQFILRHLLLFARLNYFHSQILADRTSTRETLAELEFPRCGHFFALSVIG